MTPAGPAGGGRRADGDGARGAARRSVLSAVAWLGVAAVALSVALPAVSVAAADGADAAPPVRHAVEPYLPITTQKNPCLTCHDRPELVGHPKVGIATPMPASHYFRGEGGKPTVARASYVCTTCHLAAGTSARGPGAPAVAAAGR
jgi:Nitrate reductase cytochrome c-type subunit (NapB)